MLDKRHICRGGRVRANLCSHSATILAVMLEMPMNKGIHANNESVRAKLLSFSLVAAA